MEGGGGGIWCRVGCNGRVAGKGGGEDEKGTGRTMLFEVR